jgi:4-aminobutyrate aminotransferase/(S)-3-amino-2-methylpropionate transaminase
LGTRRWRRLGLDGQEPGHSPPIGRRGSRRRAEHHKPLWTRWPSGLGGTYAGNPISCAAALGALETIENEGLVERARAIGEHVLPKLDALKNANPVVGDVRGRGAMVALEFCEPGSTEPDPAFAARVAKYCHSHGVLVLICGTYGNVIRLLPPLVIEFGLLDDALAVLGDAIEAAGR